MSAHSLTAWLPKPPLNYSDMDGHVLGTGDKEIKSTCPWGTHSTSGGRTAEMIRILGHDKRYYRTWLRMAQVTNPLNIQDGDDNHSLQWLGTYFKPGTVPREALVPSHLPSQFHVVGSETSLISTWETNCMCSEWSNHLRSNHSSASYCCVILGKLCNTSVPQFLCLKNEVTTGLLWGLHGIYI